MPPRIASCSSPKVGVALLGVAMTAAEQSSVQITGKSTRPERHLMVTIYLRPVCAVFTAELSPNNNVDG